MAARRKKKTPAEPRLVQIETKRKQSKTKSCHTCRNPVLAGLIEELLEEVHGHPAGYPRPTAADLYSALERAQMEGKFRYLPSLSSVKRHVWGGTSCPGSAAWRLWDEEQQ